MSLVILWVSRAHCLQMVKTATGQNGDKSKRRQTKTATGPK